MIDDIEIYDISPGIDIGDPVQGGTPNRVLFIDANGNVADNAGFTYIPGTGVNITDPIAIDVGGKILTLTGGSITDSSGAIDFGNESLNTTGDVNLALDGSKLAFGTAGDATIAFLNSCLEIVANAVTSTDELNLTAGAHNFKFATANVLLEINEVSILGGAVVIPEISFTTSVGALHIGSVKDLLYIRGSGAVGQIFFTNADATSSAVIGYATAADTIGFTSATGGYTFDKEIRITVDGEPIKFGGSGDATIDFTTDAMNIIANAVTATDGLEITAGYQLLKDGVDFRLNDVGNSNYVGFKAPALTANQIWTLPDADGATDDIIKTDGNGILAFATPTSHTQISFSMYDAEPARSSETSLDGAFIKIADAQPLDSVPTDLVVSKGTGKIVIVVNAGSDIAGEITVTGTSVDRDTGATTASDTDIITVDALTTDNSDTDTNGNTRHAFTGAYITSEWFTGTVTLSTTNLTLTDVDVYHVSFEQFDDTANITLDTFDANILTTSVNAEFDAYLYSIMVTGDKCNIEREASLNVGADGETALANRYWRLRRGGIAKALDGTTDGTWVDVHYSNSPAFVEDVTIKVWATEIVPLTLT